MNQDTTLPNLYDILGLAAAASTEKIKSAFRRSALQHHPDRSDSPEAAARFRVIHNAYSVLSDPEKRAAYQKGVNDLNKRIVEYEERRNQYEEAIKKFNAQAGEAQ